MCWTHSESVCSSFSSLSVAYGSTLLIFHLSSNSFHPLPTQVWQREFSNRLRVRFQGHHSKCSQCLKHRLIIKRLGHCPPARRAQHEELQRHLARQLADRRVYWFTRAQSRLDSVSPCPQQICCIIDSMDMAKYSWPKSAILYSKEFCSWAKPRMACTSMLVHGHLVLTVLTPHCISTNSSRSAEILSCGLTTLSVESRIDLRNIVLHVQADNCSKEAKNNCLLRHFSFQIALRKLFACQLSFLSSGHSHEDIDAMFSNLRAWLARFPELPTPEAFRDCLGGFFGDAKHRPHEKLRKVLLMDKFRDWCLIKNNDTMGYPIINSVG